MSNDHPTQPPDRPGDDPAGARHPAPELLSARVDDELTADERSAVDAHLARCEACRSRYEALRWTASYTDAAPRVAPPAGRTFGVPVEAGAGAAGAKPTPSDAAGASGAERSAVPDADGVGQARTARGTPSWSRAVAFSALAAAGVLLALGLVRLSGGGLVPSAEDAASDVALAPAAAPAADEETAREAPLAEAPQMEAAPPAGAAQDGAMGLSVVSPAPPDEAADADRPAGAAQPAEGLLDEAASGAKAGALAADASESEDVAEAPGAPQAALSAREAAEVTAEAVEVVDPALRAGAAATEERRDGEDDVAGDGPRATATAGPVGLRGAPAAQPAVPAAGSPTSRPTVAPTIAPTVTPTLAPTASAPTREALETEVGTWLTLGLALAFLLLAVVAWRKARGLEDAERKAPGDR